MAAKPAPPRPAPRLYLATPEVDDRRSLPTRLPGLLAAADIAAVLLRLPRADQRSMISRVKALAPAIQNAGAALLLDGHVDLVARAGADGAHLTGIAALEEAMPSLKPDRIAGVGGLATRHDSMAAGELGADYVLFGEPDAKGNGRRWRRSPSGCTGGPNCSSRPASAMPPRARRPPHSLPPAPIFCWSAISSGPIRAAPRRRWPRSARRSGRRTPQRRESRGRTGMTPDMKLLRPIAIALGGLLMATGASAQISLTPPAAQSPPAKPAAKKEAPKAPPKETPKETVETPKAPAVAKKPASRSPRLHRRPRRHRRRPSTIPMSISSTAPISAANTRPRSILRMPRAHAGDPKAMTMLGELYANGLGVKRDYAKAAEWYKRAADGGDREGMFALAMMRLAGRGGADQAGSREAAGLLGKARRTQGGL